VSACNLCSAHYGDAQPCDEGKPVNSPHRSARANDLAVVTALAQCRQGHGSHATPAELVRRGAKLSEVRALARSGDGDPDTLAQLLVEIGFGRRAAMDLVARQRS